jgi:hypothetical protein
MPHKPQITLKKHFTPTTWKVILKALPSMGFRAQVFSPFDRRFEALPLKTWVLSMNQASIWR